MAERKNIRLKQFDYRNPGYYFVTICTFRKQQLLGDVSNEKFVGHEAARIVDRCWNEIPNHFPNSLIDTSVVMPNHFHGLIHLLPRDDWKPGKHPLGDIVNSFKGSVTRKIRKQRADPALTIWQRGYYEHVVRDEIGLDRIREYITDNPRTWGIDRENPGRSALDPFDEWLDGIHSHP